MKPFNTIESKSEAIYLVQGSTLVLAPLPGQVEFVNYSCGASENCILLAPLGKYALYISGFLLRMCASFVVCHQGLSQDFKNACPKQQFQNFCPSRLSY